MRRFIIICLFAVSTIAHAADIYVAKPDGFTPSNPSVNDVVTWNSVSSNPVTDLTFGVDAFSSIIDATSVAGAGDTIHIASGIYTEGSEIFVQEALNFIGDGPGLTILDGASNHALLRLNGSSTLKDLTIQNGIGGISSFAPELSLSNIHFRNNSSEFGNGALVILRPEEQQEPATPHVVRIEGCLFSNNAAAVGSPGCIYHEGDAFGSASSDVIIVNTTFSSNPVLAIRSLAGTLTLTQCTFYDNPAGAFDASISPQSTPGSSVLLKNSLVLDSYLAPIITSNGTNFLADGPITAGDLSYSNTTASVPADLIDIVLSDNGGATATHKLSANSVAIDAGTNADAVDALNNALAFDQRGPGFPRISEGVVDIGAFEDLTPTLTLSIADEGISENGGITTVTVSRNTGTIGDLTVNLSSDDTSEATVEATLTILDGETSGTASISAVDDEIVDGDQTVTITATASGFTGDSAPLQITDDDTPTLTVSIADEGISENGGITTVTVSRNTGTIGDLTVNLSSDDTSEATVEATLTILDGETSGTASISAFDDEIVDGDQIVTITAAASGFTGDSAPLQITDDDTPTLTVSIADEGISENGGITTVTVSRNTGTIGDLTVNLSSDDTSEATVGPTLTIPDGQTFGTASISAVDDEIVDGDQIVTITAAASGFTGDSGQLNVTDDDELQITLEGGGTLSEPNSFSRSPLSPSETDIILRRNGSLGDVAVNIAIDPGSQAVIENDFTINGAISPNFSVTIPDGESEFALRVQVIDDIAAEKDETFIVLLLPGSFISGNTSVSVSIAQNDFGVVSLEDFNPSSSPNGGEGTLRQAIINAKAGLTIAEVPPSNPVIVFPPDLSGEIKLIAGPFQLDQSSFSIIGPGSQQISISGENASRIFFVSDPAQDLTYRISGLTLTGGFSATNGGAIFSTESLLLSDCVLSESAANIGGAIANEGRLELDHCTLFNNTATIYGGAIDNFSGTLSLRGCAIAENHAEFGGGIENGSGSELWVDSSTFSRNSAGTSGGAIDSFGAFTNISNTTISGNEAGFGAGIFNEQSTVRIWQSTIVKNIAVTSVGGILTSVITPVSTTLHNTIVAGNIQSGSPSDLSTNNPSFANVTPSSTNNLIGHAGSAGGLSNGINGNIVGTGAANLFRPLADNGGPTATHALLPGSPAINAGNPIFALDSGAIPLTTDQRGFPRFAFGTNDIGAFEVSENPISIVSLDVVPAASVALTWTSETGVSYDVLRSTDLSAWQEIASGIMAVGGLTSWIDTGPPLGKAFYIVRYTTAE